jgi:hypothetical protein
MQDLSRVALVRAAERPRCRGRSLPKGACRGDLPSDRLSDRDSEAQQGKDEEHPADEPHRQELWPNDVEAPRYRIDCANETEWVAGGACMKVASTGGIHSSGALNPRRVSNELILVCFDAVAGDNR